MTIWTWLQFAAGLALLVAGAELLVRGASRLAAAVGISPLVVGLTVVAFGTGSPELAVSVRAVLTGSPDIAVGNVVGSNIANVLLVLGAAALAAPLVVAVRVVRLDVPLMVGVSALLWVFGLDRSIGRGDGAVFVAVLVAYTFYLIRQSRRESRAAEAEFAAEYGARAKPRIPLQVVLVASGLVLLVFGSRWLVDSATVFALALGVSELLIGLTVVAVGTSLPEAATSIIAAARGERDIAVGNAVGSNIFNILGVLGLSGLIAPGGVLVSDQLLRFDIPFVLAAAVACLPVFFSGHRIDRWEGALFLAYYAAYIAWLALAAYHHPALAVFTTVMLAFVVPLTALTLGLIVVRARRTGSPAGVERRG